MVRSNKQKQFYKNRLIPLSNKKLSQKRFVGFDVETITEKNDFYMGGLWYYNSSGKEVYKEFWNQEEMIKFLLKSQWRRNTYIVATNLHFDLTVLFYNTDYWNDLEVLYKAGDIIYAEYKFFDGKNNRKIRFIDTMNYCMFSVKKMGEILNIPKLPHPRALGRIAKNREEQEELAEYNKYDCKISALFMYFVQKGVYLAGGNLKMTIASTSFDVWRRGFQPQELIKEEQVLKEDIKPFIFQGYYGGRTEVFKKGMFKNVHYYDVNSLYPSVMKNKFPLPQSVQKVQNPSIQNIKSYMGVTKCTVESPNTNKPFLPYKSEKLIFPNGRFTGTWNNCELEKALSLGYKILKIHRQIIYTKSFKPFDKFVDFFYKMKNEYKQNKDPMEKVMKLILNSLYGKFGQKKVTETNIIDVNSWNGDYDELIKKIGDDFVEKNNKILSNHEKSFNGKNCYPIIASYVTSYARMLMYDYIKQDDVIYTDTDSVVVESESYKDSSVIGEMAYEGFYEEGYFVRPKFYYLYDKENDKHEIHIKGVNKADINDFLDIIEGKTVYKQKFTKIKESIRRAKKVNEIMTIPKKLSLKDDKRIWEDLGKIQISKPIEIYNG